MANKNNRHKLFALHGRKGVFFTLDAVIGLLILFAGVFVAYFAFVQQPVLQPGIGYHEDLIGMLEQTRISDIDPHHAQVIGLLMRQGRIQNDSDKTLLSQIGEFYYLSTKEASGSLLQKIYLDDAASIIQSITKNTVSPVYGWQAQLVDQDRIVPLYTAPQGPKKDDAKILLVKQRIIFGTYKQREAYGPYLLEVSLWG